MEDGLDPLGRQQPRDRGAVAVVADVQPRPVRDGGAVARCEVVKHDNVMAGRKERLSRDRAHIPGTTRHEDLRHAANHTVRRRTASATAEPIDDGAAADDLGPDGRRR